MVSGGRMRKPVLMPGRRARVALAACAASAFILCGAQANGQALGNVAGTVTDSAGAPLLGAEVTVDGARVRTFTDDQGVFHLGGVPYGARTLSVSRLAGYYERLEKRSNGYFITRDQIDTRARACLASFSSTYLE